LQDEKTYDGGSDDAAARFDSGIRLWSRVDPVTVSVVIMSKCRATGREKKGVD
jgi:hypothetical protein